MKKKNIQKLIDDYTKERGWDKNHPADITKSILIEASELLENWQWNHKNADEIPRDSQMYQNIKDELGDVFIYAIELALRFGWDFEEVVESKLSKVKNKYSVEVVKKHKGNITKVKLAHRRKKL